MKKVFKIVFICIIVFCIFYYIFYQMGNNKISNEEKRIDDILKKYLNYNAEITATIYSNKNEDTYTIKQEVRNDYSKMEILQPKNIEGMIIENDGDKIRIINRLLDFEKSYTKQSNFLNNNLFLDVFVDEYYKNNSISTLVNNNEEIKIEISLEDNFNTYFKYKELVIDSKTNKPKELIVKDNTKKIKMDIIYNNIDI